jgi:alkanesulfonate monooxygenase SsuD/methylene tetrahydromethanopterin reductase-like flavin-dependent oxidoreductase (luciferase family)
MEETVDILQRAWTESPLDYDGRFHKLHVPAIRPKPVQQPGPPLWRSVISPGSFKECGRLGMPILTARLPVERIRERWATYAAGIDEGGHDAATKARLLAQSALWRNVYVGESDAEAEDALAALLVETRAHMMHVREAHNPVDFQPEPATLNAWTDPKVPDSEAVPFLLRTGCLYGSAKRVRDQVAELSDVGVQHLLCQTGFGAMSHDQNLASMRRFGEQVMPAFA